jgi:hypothetical protein
MESYSLACFQVFSYPGISSCHSPMYQHILHCENKTVYSSNLSKYRYANKNFSIMSSTGPSGDLIIDPSSETELLSESFCDPFTINNYRFLRLPKLVPDSIWC